MCTRFFSRSKKYVIHDTFTAVPKTGQNGTTTKPRVSRPATFLPPGATLTHDEPEPPSEPIPTEPPSEPKHPEPKSEPKHPEPKSEPKHPEPKSEPKHPEPKSEPRHPEPKSEPKYPEPASEPKHLDFLNEPKHPDQRSESKHPDPPSEPKHRAPAPPNEPKHRAPQPPSQPVVNNAEAAPPTPEITVDESPDLIEDTASIDDDHLADIPSGDEATDGERSINPEPPTPIKIEEERRPGVIPLPVTFDENAVDDIEKHFKAPEDDKLIRDAVQRSDFLNKILKGNLLKEVVDAMYNREIKPKEVIIKEGEKGSHMYVSAKGRYEVSVKGKGIVNTFEDIRVFGEMAILYNDKRNATIKAVKPGRVWVLDRSVYQKLMVRFNIREQDEMLTFLQNVPNLNKVATVNLRKVANLLKVKYFAPGTAIVRQGDKGDKFYIIRAGTVTITREGEGVVGNFGKGQYFGEIALLREDVRQATVTADAPGVECLTLRRQQFIDHFGELREDGLLTVPTQSERKNSAFPTDEHDDVELKDLKIITTLGVGGFGRVELVQHKSNNLIFALKYLKKIDMVEQNQQEHVRNEKNIQVVCRSKFIIRLYRSYRDAKYIYFLMEPCLGGDLWTLLQRQRTRRFDEKDARFIAACVLESFTYLHERGIVYRDLKPENLLIDEHGYIKLTDFGFAKKLGSRGRTFTFAGTPEYVAPEIILSRGHDKAVDYWAFGIFIFELLTGRTPFRTNDASHMRTYNKILAGIDSVDFPSYISPKARNIIEKLCKAIPTERLGCQRNGVKDIKNHRWFLGFDWLKLNEGKLSAPFKPKLKSNTDTRYFEAFKKDNDCPPDETSGWDKDF